MAAAARILNKPLSATHFYIGIMSGTSTDGADAILCDFSAAHPRTLAFHSAIYSDALRNEILALCVPTHNELERAAAVSITLATIYADLVKALLAKANMSATAMAAIGCHGQTVRHRPNVGFTLQLQNAALLAELTSIDVVADFRSRDMAAGGQGAPLVPAFHDGIFRSTSHDRVVVNVGGISNITVLNRKQITTGFDCGPGNVLMDGWIYQHRKLRFDDGGAWAASGKVLPDLLDALLAEPYFQQTPPKSSGRELFNMEWLKANIHAVFEPVDVQATLLELTALAICNEVKKVAPDNDELIVCGGGALNITLMARLATLLPTMQVLPSDCVGVPAQQVEAMAFAWFAKQAVEGKALNLTAITGARQPNILGAIYRH